MAFVHYWASFLLSLTGAGLSLKMPYADLDENLWPWMPRLLFVFNFTLFLWPSITKYTNTAAFPNHRYSNRGFNVANISLLCGRQLLRNHFFLICTCVRPVHHLSLLEDSENGLEPILQGRVHGGGPGACAGDWETSVKKRPMIPTWSLVFWLALNRCTGSYLNSSNIIWVLIFNWCLECSANIYFLPRRCVGQFIKWGRLFSVPGVLASYEILEKRPNLPCKVLFLGLNAQFIPGNHVHCIER